MCGYRGADTQSYYIHMIAKVQIKLRDQKKTQQDLKKLCDTDKQQDRKVRRDFCMSLWNKFVALDFESKDPRKRGREI
ncbi:hypothetical protein QYM36_002747 [Artemia franciscana]|uniref:Uncharacterized protein n=1 Tax=Artemia franciscana TaxID=6661 RepID=A0AA88II98_ARTSF|nr:hypothetical protein QYM36_002747 [Artemia franciscana]